MADDKPAPDALLMAQLLPKWRKHAVHVFFYKASTNPELALHMSRYGYTDPPGIAWGGHGDASKRHIKNVSGVDQVKLQLVFVRDTSLHLSESPFRHLLGRDISEEEWQAAREWLARKSHNKEGAEHGG